MFKLKADRPRPPDYPQTDKQTQTNILDWK